ncbi:hypothetical protein Ciccas_011104, partial [Cichlidogyrus casuarinus]
MLRMIAADPDSLHRQDVDGWNYKIHQDLKERGSVITLQELADYKPKWREPLEIPIQTTSKDGKNKFTHSVLAMPPPSSGALVAFGLNIMSVFQYRDAICLESCVTAGKFFHRLVETMKVIMNRRSGLGDSDFDHDHSVAQTLRKLVDYEYAKQWAKRFRTGETFEPPYYVDSENKVTQSQIDPKTGTSHISILGPDGSAVSVTSTINTPLGSLLMGRQSGILFNNQMDDFSKPAKPNAYQLPSSSQNYIEPGKRPMSSMCPIIVVDQEKNRVQLVAGASGGSRIITSVFSFAVLNLHLRLNIKEATDMPRLHHQWTPDHICIENDFPGVCLPT